jgi:uncharacterized protein YndB with AHSA1/START domain
MTQHGGASIDIAAPPEKVYDLVTDVTRMGEWSPETYKAAWVDGATGPAPGARFKGSNKDGFMRWSTKPVVEMAERGREFTFATVMAGKKLTRWSYKLSPSDGGTHVEESWETVETIPLLSAFVMRGNRAQRLDEGCAQTLARLKDAAEA